MHDGCRQRPIERHGMTGDRRTAALFAADGSIPWLCLPDYDGAPLFGALLDKARIGLWRIAPKGAGVSRQFDAGDSAAVAATWASDDATLAHADATACRTRGATKPAKAGAWSFAARAAGEPRLFPRETGPVRRLIPRQHAAAVQPCRVPSRRHRNEQGSPVTAAADDAGRGGQTHPRDERSRYA